MSQTPRSIGRPRDSYFMRAHRPLNCLAFVLPLLLFFHVGVIFHKPNPLLAPRDLAELGRMLGIFGPTAAFLPAFIVVATLLIIQLARHEPWRVEARVVAGMAGESVVWAAPMIAMGMLGSRLLAAGSVPPDDLTRKLLIAAGAGVYEEFIFRLLFVGGAITLLVKGFNLRRDAVAICAVAVSAVCFSLYHLTAEQVGGLRMFPWRVFLFRLIAGLYLGGVYLFRGYGVAAGAHVAFDVWVGLWAAWSPAGQA